MILAFDIVILAVVILALIVLIVSGSVELLGIDPNTMEPTSTTSVHWDENDLLSIGWKVMFIFGLCLEILTIAIPAFGKKVRKILSSTKFWSYIFLIGSMIWPLAILTLTSFVPDENISSGLGIVLFVSLFSLTVHTYAYAMFMISKLLRALVDRFDREGVYEKIEN